MEKDHPYFDEMQGRMHKFAKGMPGYENKDCGASHDGAGGGTSKNAGMKGPERKATKPDDALDD